MQAVVLAGGLGTRLKPVTESIPKCLAPVNGKPFLDYLLRLLKNQRITDVILCTGYLGEQIEEFFGNGEKLPIKLRYSQEKGKLLGTGGALKQAERFLNESFFVINGDTYLDIDYHRVAQLFLASDKRALIVTSRCESGILRGDLEINEETIVTRYDKETSDRMSYINAGVMMFKKDVISGIEAGRSVSLEKEVFPPLIHRHEVMAYVTEQKFYDIGTLTSLQVFETRVQEGCL